MSTNESAIPPMSGLLSQFQNWLATVEHTGSADEVASGFDGFAVEFAGLAASCTKMDHWCREAAQKLRDLDTSEPAAEGE